MLELKKKKGRYGDKFHGFAYDDVNWIKPTKYETQPENKWT